MMAPRKVHLIADRSARVTFTRCGRVGDGSGVGMPIISFYQDGGGFDATEDAALVTCKRCLNALQPATKSGETA